MKNKYWIWLYTASVIIIPAVKINSKFIFFAELMLLPFIYFALKNFKKNDFNNPLLKATLFVLGGLFIGFISGYWRGELGHFVTVYDWQNISDSFNLKIELVKFLRWSLMFSTPFILFLWLRGENRVSEFINSVVFWGGISSVLSIFESFNFINLQNIYPYSHDINWVGRSYGTFASPLEASLVYGFVIVVSIISGKIKFLAVALLSLVALVLTHSATGIMATTVGVLFAARLKIYPQSVNGLLPATWFNDKFRNLLTRFIMWKKWFLLCLAHPRLLLSGMGFTQLVVDNSFLLFLVYGGIILATAIIYFFKIILKTVTPQIIPLLIVWFVSWFSLDSVGYWGIGRLCWFLLGITAAQNFQRLDVAGPPNASTARG